MIQSSFYKILTHHDYLDCVEITKLHQSIGDEKLYRLCVHNKVATIAADALVRCYDRIGRQSLARSL